MEGQGTEQETPLIQPGASATLTLTLEPGTYEIYCPVGDNSHKKLGMDTHLKVVGAAGPSGSGYQRGAASEQPTMREHGDTAEHDGTAAPAEPIRVTGGGPVIQILPGPFPFPDSAGPILKSFGPEHEALESQIQNGPYSNNVVPISGTFTFSAWDKGAIRDSVDGVAEFTTQDGARWKVVLDRVQTKDVPHHPKFGGVIRGLVLPRRHRRTHAARSHDQQRRGAVVHRPPVPERRARDGQRVRPRDASLPHPAGQATTPWRAGTAPRTRSTSCSCRSPRLPAHRSSTRQAGSCSSTGSGRSSRPAAS